MFNLSQTEQEILEYLWKDAQWHTSVDFWEHFNSIGRPCKRQAIHSYLTRMEAKGLLIKNNKKFIYAYTRDEFEQKKAQEILDTMYDGSVKKMMVALAGNKRLSREDANEMRNFLDELE